MQVQEKTLYDVLSDLWAARFYMVIGIFVSLVLAGFFWMSAVSYYSAQMIVGPAHPMNGEMRGRYIDGRTFSLASGDMLSAEASHFLRYEQIFRGPTVASVLLRDERIKDGLAAERSFSFLEAVPATTPESLALYLQKRVHIAPVADTPLRRVSYLHPDKDFAVYLIEQMGRVSDGLIRISIKREAQERIDYLQDSLGKTSNPEHRRALTDLLMEQERLKMLVSIGQPYSALVIEPASASARVVWPDGYLVFALFSFCGALLGFVIYGGKHCGV